MKSCGSAGAPCMAIAGAASAVAVGAKASAIGSAQSAARKTAGAGRKHGTVQKAFEKMRFTARDCITPCRRWPAARALAACPAPYRPSRSLGEAVKFVPLQVHAL